MKNELIGQEVEWTYKGKTIRGVVEKAMPAKLMDVSSMKEIPAIRFVVKDKAGKRHTTCAMATTKAPQ